MMFFIYEDYSVADFATDLYTAFNDAYVNEPNVRMNISMIPRLCNELVKSPRKGVYLSIMRDISLMEINGAPSKKADIEIHFYAKIVNKGGIPFIEYHADIRTERNDKQTGTIVGIVKELCQCAKFITKVKKC